MFFFQVTIDSRLIDEEGQTWNIGVKTNLAIKSFEDGAGRPQSSTLRPSGPSVNR